jgi:hypothetical protein
MSASERSTTPGSRRASARRHRHGPIVRKWAGAQAASGNLRYDPKAGIFELPLEQAAAFADEDSPVCLLGGYTVSGGLTRRLARRAETFPRRTMRACSHPNGHTPAGRRAARRPRLLLRRRERSPAPGPRIRRWPGWTRARPEPHGPGASRPASSRLTAAARHAIVAEADPAIMRRAVTHGQPQHPSAPVAVSTVTGARIASGRRGGLDRWAIRWAKPGGIGPYQAQPRAVSGAPVVSDLQVFRRLEARQTPCFTRDESPIAARPPLRRDAPRQLVTLDRRARGMQRGPRPPSSSRAARITARVFGRRPRRSRGRAATPRVRGFRGERRTRLWHHRRRACLRSGTDAQNHAARASRA